MCGCCIIWDGINNFGFNTNRRSPITEMLLEIFFIGEGLFPADQRRKGADEIADLSFYIIMFDLVINLLFCKNET